jgi:hypothetical protein
MSALITSALVTPCGSITNPTLGGYIDAAGNVVGSPGFLPNYVIDYAGNLGAIPVTPTTDCTLIATIIGSALPPGDWEMQSSTVETVGLNGGTISANFTAGTTAPNLLHSFVSKNATGYLTGVVSGTGTWTIRSGPEAINGTGYIGSGLLVATGANTHSGLTTMQTGTKLQLGADCSNNVTKTAALTLAEGAVATQYNGWNVNTFLTNALDNNGTYNVTGCGACGVGGVGRATTVNNNGVINLDKTSWGFSSTWAGTGFVNVKSGATFQLAGNGVNNVTRVNLNGNGWKDANCVEQGALHATVGNVNQNMRINVQSASTIKTAIGAGGVGLTGLITGSAPLTVTTLGTALGGTYNITNTANTYNGTLTFDRVITTADYGTSMQFANVVLTNGARLSSNATQTIGSLASADPTTAWQIGGSNNVFIKNNGITTFAGKINNIGSIANVWLEGGSQNQLTLTNTGHTGTVYARNGSKLILQGATFTGAQGQVRVSAGSTVSAGTSTTASVSDLYIDATSALDVRSTGTGTGLLRYTASQVINAGWKVNALDPLPPGTYPILQKPNTTLIPMPTLGINNTGGNVTFTQVGNFLNMVVS